MLFRSTVFETGSNQWRTFSHWPPSEAKPSQLRLQAGGRLQLESADGKVLNSESAAAAHPATDPGFDQFVSDPAKPVPYSEEITNRMTNEYMTDDQRFAARRPDVLVYQSDILTDDLVMAGPLQAQFYASTSETDADFVVKLIDVFPDGADAARLPNYQMMVRSEVLRGRFRNSYEKPEAFVPNQPAAIHLELLDVLHRFQKGHRIMIQIQSTWFPLVDRNPQQFVPNIYFAKPEDFRSAVHRVYRTTQHPATISFGQLP